MNSKNVLMSLPKSQRLKSKIAIDLLFKNRHILRQRHLSVTYNFMALNEELRIPILVSVSVPKRLIRTAVKRNLVKRRILEAYRLNQSIINIRNGQNQLHLMFIYQEKEVLDYNSIEKNVIQLLKRLSCI